VFSLGIFIDIDTAYKLYSLLLQLQDLRVGQVKEPCIGLTQENSIENSVQDCLPYILISNGLCNVVATTYHKDK